SMPSLLRLEPPRMGRSRAEAWRRFEQSLARGTWDDLSQRRLLSQDELARRAQFRHQLTRLDRQLEEALAAKESPQRKQRLDEVPGQRLESQERLAELARQLDERYGPAAGQALDRAVVQQALPADAALLGWIDLPGDAQAADPNGEHWAVVVRQKGDPVCVRL